MCVLLFVAQMHFFWTRRRMSLSRYLFIFPEINSSQTSIERKVCWIHYVDWKYLLSFSDDLIYESTMYTIVHCSQHSFDLSSFSQLLFIMTYEGTRLRCLQDFPTKQTSYNNFAVRIRGVLFHSFLIRTSLPGAILREFWVYDTMIICIALGAGPYLTGCDVTGAASIGGVCAPSTV